MGFFKKLFGSRRESAEEWWERGRALVARGEYDQAIACFNKALDLTPGDTANYLERGNAYLLKGDADAAIADFTQFIRLNQGPAVAPDLPRGRKLEVEESGDVTVVNFADSEILDEQSIQVLGEQLLSLVEELGRKKIALNLGNVELLSSAALGTFVALNRKLSVAGGWLALCNIDPRIYEVLEITKLSKLFRIGPLPVKEDPDGNLGAVASRPKPPSAADFLESRPWRHRLAIAHANRGAANCCKGNYDAAIADYTEAIRLHRAFAGAYVNRGNAFASKSDYRRAIADYTEAIRLQPGWVGEPNAYRGRAEAYRALGDEDKAAMDERRMSACDHSARGEAHLGRGELGQAIAAHTEAIRLDPDSERYAARARAFQAKGDYGRAIADYSEAIRLEPQDAMLYLMRANMHRVRGDEALAAEDERKMEELHK
jgi:anti-anti-sigma factor